MPQKGNIFHKWKQRSRVGICLGPSPIHSRNVVLVLDLETGLVSPQFHHKHNPSFHTTKEIRTPSDWQLKVGFLIQRESDVTKRKLPKENLKTLPRWKVRKKTHFQLEENQVPLEEVVADGDKNGGNSNKSQNVTSNKVTCCSRLQQQGTKLQRELK